MLRSLKRGWTSCLDHYAAACLIPALFILTLTGVGDVLTVSLLGLLLCGTGLTRGGARADLWILIPLLLYDLACLASAFAAYGTLTDGYGVIHGIFPVLYLLLAAWERRIAGFWKRAVPSGRALRQGPGSPASFSWR